MTNSKMEELARQLVASKHWRWLDGMLCARSRTRVISTQTDQNWILWSDDSETSSNCGALPDLTDAATLGCLLQLVRDAWGDPTLTPDFIPIGSPQNDKGFPHWFCWVEWPNNDPSPGVSRIEAGALVAALLAAPEAA